MYSSIEGFFFLKCINSIMKSYTGSIDTSRKKNKNIYIINIQKFNT